MLARAHRFHGYNSLSFVYRNGQSVRAKSLALKYCLNSRRQTFRVSVVISKKVEKSAVRRNRIRRQLYEVISSKSAKIDQPYDIVITVFSAQLKDMPPKELSQLVGDLLSQARIVH